MAAFDYRALNQKGREKKGVIEAENSRHARQLLKEQTLVPLEVVSSHGSPHASGRTQREAAGNNRRLRLFSGKLGYRELAMVTRQLAALLQAAMPLEEALHVIVRQTESQSVRRIFSAVRASVREGYSLADALGQFPRSFSRLYLATVAAGQESGRLDLVLAELADYAEATREFRQKVQLALIYPVLLIVFSVLIVTGLMIYVVPDVIAVFTSNGQALPVLTQGLVALSNFLQHWGWLLLVALLIFTFLSVWSFRQPATRLRLHKKFLHMPFIKRISRNANAARYAGTLSILVKSGVPLLNSMQIAGEVVNNDFLRDKLKQAAVAVSEGGSLNQALENTGYFPPIMVHMIASGEVSGRLDDMLEKTARQQQRDLQNLVVALVGLLEPLMLIVMGVVVLLIVLAILLPILNLNQLIT